MPSIVKKEDDKKWLEELLGDISTASASKQLALGTASGWVTGYLTMKIGKAVAIAVGGSIIVLQIAQHKGYIKIDWDKVTRATDKVVDKIEKETSGKGPSRVDKMERYVDRQIEKAEKYVERQLEKADKKRRNWFGALFNNGNNRGYELQELHLFLMSYVAGLAFGIASG